jgi:hypothetical protein
MAVLTTSNLPVKSIVNALGVAKAKDIFYEADGTLRSELELKMIVNKWGLGVNCPGSDQDSKITNLLTDRKLSYFKGYDHNFKPASVTHRVDVSNDGGTVVINVHADPSLSWTASIPDEDLQFRISGSNTGTGGGSIEVVVYDNYDEFPRTATVVFVFSEDLGTYGSGKSLYSIVNQEGRSINEEL